MDNVKQFLFFLIIVCIVIGIIVCGIRSLIYLGRALRFVFRRQYRQGLRAFIMFCVLGLIPGLIIAVQLRFVHDPPPYKSMCLNNLRQTILSMKMYANDNGENYPTSFDDLVGNYLKVRDLGVFICRASGHKVGSSTNIHEWTDYAYVSGLTDTDNIDCVVAFCLPENHKGNGSMVGFLGGRVEWCFNQHSYTNSFGRFLPSFRDLTNTPSLFYGTTNEAVLTDLKKRTKIIWPKRLP